MYIHKDLSVVSIDFLERNRVTPSTTSSLPTTFPAQLTPEKSSDHKTTTIIALVFGILAVIACVVIIVKFLGEIRHNLQRISQKCARINFEPEEVRVWYAFSCRFSFDFGIKKSWNRTTS